MLLTWNSKTDCGKIAEAALSIERPAKRKVLDLASPAQDVEDEDAKSASSSSLESPEPYISPPTHALRDGYKKSSKVQSITACKRTISKKDKESKATRPRNFSRDEDLMICQAMENS